MMIIKILRSFSCCFAVLFKRSVPSPLLLFFWIESCFVSFTALIWMTKEQIVTGLSQDCHRTHTTSEQRILCKKTKRGRNPKRQQEDNSSSDSSQVKACKTLSPRMHSLLNLLLFLRKTSLVITRRWSVWRNENERTRTERETCKEREDDMRHWMEDSRDDQRHGVSQKVVRKQVVFTASASFLSCQGMESMKWTCCFHCFLSTERVYRLLHSSSSTTSSWQVKPISASRLQSRNLSQSRSHHDVIFSSSTFTALFLRVCI